MHATTSNHTQPASMRPMMRMPVTIAQALMFLERHGHNPIMTPDGILVVDPERLALKDCPPGAGDYFSDLPTIEVLAKAVEAHCEDDVWVDVPYVFPVVGNVVDLAPIREWQGY